MDHWNSGIPAPPEAPTETPSVAAEVVFGPVQTPTPAKRTRRGWTIALAALLVVAIAGATVALVSLAQVAGRLATSEGALRDTTAELSTSKAHASELEARVGLLEDGAADQQADLDDTEKALTTCQDFLVASARIAKGQSPGISPAEFASLVVGCFEGKVPRGLF